MVKGSEETLMTEPLVLPLLDPLSQALGVHQASEASDIPHVQFTTIWLLLYH
jgi:hypothetical protein